MKKIISRIKSNMYSTQIVKGSVISLFAVFLIGLINLLIRRALAVNLTSTDYGFIYSIFSFLSIFIAIFDAGLGQSTVILIAQDNADKPLDRTSHIFGSFFTLRVMIAVMLTLSLLLMADSLAEGYFKNPSGSGTLKIMCLWMGSMIVFGSLVSLFDGLKQFALRQILFLTYYGTAFLIIMIAGSSITPQMAATAMVGGGTVSSIIFIFFIRKRYHFPLLIFGNALKAHFRRIADLSKWVSISAAGLMIMFSMDTIMLTYYSNLDRVALYNIALPIMQVFLSIMLIFPQVIAPIVTELWHLKKVRYLRFLVGITTLIIFATMAANTVLVFFFKTRLIALIFNNTYLEAGTALVILISGVPFYIVTQIHLTLLNGMGKQKKASLLVVTGLGLNIVLNSILIPLADINGAALSTLISYIYLFLLSGIFFWQSSFYRYNPPYKK